MQEKVNAIAAVILSTEEFVSRLPRTKAAPGAFTKMKDLPPAADPLVLTETIKRTRKVAADLQPV